MYAEVNISESNLFVHTNASSLVDYIDEEIAQLTACDGIEGMFEFYSKVYFHGFTTVPY